MIRVLIGNMFESEMKTLVNTVNCVGVMGKGIAQVVKEKFPRVFEDYAHRCNAGQVRLGEPYHYTDLTGISIVNFPTKNHWRATTRLGDIERGLDFFVEHVHEWKIESVAFPPLGCGNGGLDWLRAGPLMYSRLAHLDIPVEIYAPFGTPVAQLKEDFLAAANQMDLLTKGRQRMKLRPEWAALVEVLYELERQPYTNPVGREVFKWICYVMTHLGLDTGFRTGRGGYSYFSGEVQEAVNVLANNNWLIEQRHGRTTRLKVGRAYVADRTRFRKKTGRFSQEIAKTVDLCSRIKNTDQAMQIAAVIAAVSDLEQEHDSADVSEQDVLDHVLHSRKTWALDSRKQDDVVDTIRNLESLGWVNLQFNESLRLPDGSAERAAEESAQHALF